MLFWIVVQCACIYLCRGRTVDSPSHSNSEHEATAEDNMSQENAMNTLRVIHDSETNSDKTDDEQLNQQITLLSQLGKKGDVDRMHKLEDVVGWLQSNNSTPTTDSDTDHINQLLQKVVNNTLRADAAQQNERTTTSLDDLEMLRDYLHEMNNAVDFGKMGGLSIMLQLVLDYPFIEVRTSAAWTIGLACQNNPTLMEIAHNISTVQNILYLLKSSSPNEEHTDTEYTESESGEWRDHRGHYHSNNNFNGDYPKINLLDINSINHLNKLIWTLSALTRQNEQSYAILKEHDATDILYDWIMEIYEFWNSNKDDPRLLDEQYKQKVVEKVLMFASDVVVLNPEQHLFVEDKWCDIFAAHFNYAQQYYLLREITLAYWNVAINKLFCVNCIPFGKGRNALPNKRLSIDIGLKKLKNMDIEDEFDVEMRDKAIHLLDTIELTTGG